MELHPLRPLPRIKHPSRYFIQYLVSRRSEDPTSILATLEDLGLPVPKAIYEDATEEGVPPKLAPGTERHALALSISRFADSVRYPVGYNPARQRNHTPTRTLLRTLRVLDLWTFNSYVALAHGILLGDPHMRRMLEVMLLGPLRHDGIAEHLRERFDMTLEEMNPTVVRYYAHYFWNYDTLNKAEWQHLLHEHIDLDTADLQRALLAPRTSVGAAMVLHIADNGSLDSLREAVMYRSIRDSAYQGIMAVMNTFKPGVSQAQAMMFYMTAMGGAQEQLDLRQGGSAELLEELRRIEAQYDPTKVTTIHDLPMHQLPNETEQDDEHT